MPHPSKATTARGAAGEKTEDSWEVSPCLQTLPFK